MPSLPKLSTLKPSLDDRVVGVGELGGELRSIREAVATADDTVVRAGVTLLLFMPVGPGGIVDVGSPFVPRREKRLDNNSLGRDGCYNHKQAIFKKNNFSVTLKE